jgi:hypothetical protein
MSTPNHDEIARHARKLWHDRGCPADRDTEIWLEAERELNERAAAESETAYHLSPAQTEQKSIQAATQKDDARAPQVPHHTGPKAKPAETGKPLWTRPHSS